MLQDPLGELPAVIVRRVLLEQPTQQIAATLIAKPIEKASWWAEAAVFIR